MHTVRFFSMVVNNSPELMVFDLRLQASESALRLELEEHRSASQARESDLLAEIRDLQEALKGAQAVSDQYPAPRWFSDMLIHRMFRHLSTNPI